MRVYVYRHASDAVGWQASGRPADLGDGYLLPRADARHLTIPIAPCPAWASVDFVPVSPYGHDPSLAGTPGSDDHVAYVYHGWNLGSRFITISLNGIYFARLAYARLSMQKNPAADDLAVKIIVPAGCDASPEDVMAVLRRAARSGSRSGDE
ncbi:hypothetical protein MKK75_35550 [Methylobacterium sp. J-030]|uniref:hypothetical protein n=1 Tax=Methylobacterium sp. J-030 TaxID=2836627 RepID=UPI001FBB4DD6|nr:hypothetical protein [Methylobacterium sp. J-030]MCJ2074048.1 hypothetical protein [Methylobacterium sp. J-030]